MNSAARLCLVGAILVVAAPSAHAQIDLAWNNCFGVGNASDVKTYACDGSLDGIYQYLVPTLTPTFDIPFRSMDAILEFRSPSGTLPDYWRIWGTGCRPGVFSAAGTVAGVGNTTDCPYVYGSLSVFMASDGVPGGAGPDFIRMQFGATSGSLVTLQAGKTYRAGVVRIDPVLDPACTGCAEDVCVRLVSINLDPIQYPGTAVTLTTPLHRNYVSWQGPPGLCAGATPLRDRTWGSVKALYR